MQWCVGIKLNKMSKYLWIDVKETVSKSIGLEIGKEISQEQADYLLSLTEKKDEFDTDTEEYSLLDGFVGNHIYDSEGFSDTTIYVKEK